VFRRRLATGDEPFTTNLVVATGVKRLPRPIPLSAFKRDDGSSPSPHQWPYTITKLPRGYGREVASDNSLAEEVSAVEGELRQRLVRHRHREARLRAAKIKAVLRMTGALRCEVPSCRFDFASAYGAMGREYAQVHHLLPLSGSSPSRRHPRDLAIVCANCHAMIHRNGACRDLVEIDRALKLGKSRRPAV
jgi:hypothetical protein